MDSSEVKNELVNYYDNMVENINKLVEINVDLFKNLDESTKLEKMFLFHNSRIELPKNQNKLYVEELTVS